MRISGGSAKGRKVGSRKAFVSKGDSDELRPTAAKVRQAIFNILAGRIEGCVFLDLYAGTGAVGIEALSRGAEHVVFVEDNASRVAIIKDLLEKFGFTEKASVIKAQTASYLKKTKRGQFDIIFLDPPYASDELAISFPIIDQSDIIANGGVVVAEHSSKKDLSSLNHLKIRKKYRYGDTALTLYEYVTSEEITAAGEEQS